MTILLILFWCIAQVMELEKGGSGVTGGNDNLQQRVNELTDKMHALERDNQAKQEVHFSCHR